MAISKADYGTGSALIVKQLADILVILGLLLALIGAGGLAVFFGRLRSQLLKVDPDLYYSAGFDTTTMFLIQGAGPEGMQNFLVGREYETHNDAQVRHYGSRLLLCRKAFVVSFGLLVASGLVRLIAA